MLERNLGRTICRHFYFPYAAKIWGAPPADLDPEQARRRVSAGSLAKMVRKVVDAVPGFGRGGGGRGRFFYPRRGYGQISDAYHRAAVEAGARIRLGTEVRAITTEAGRVQSVVAAGRDGEVTLPARLVLSTIPLPILVSLTRPAAEPAVRASVDALRYRAMILVYLVLETDRFTEYDAHYFPGPQVAITRLSEPKNYGLAEHPGVTILCAELPCGVGDAHWTATDDALAALVIEALDRANLRVDVRVRRIVTRRLAQAYPIYARGYREHFDRLDAWVGRVAGLLTIGRQGLFAHDNTHHTLAMAYAASDCLDDRGALDRESWRAAREAFEMHVVED